VTLFVVQLRTEFLALLAEQRNLTRRVRWSEVKKTIDGDPRYKAVDSSTQREEWFREFAKGLPEETNSVSIGLG
jgi:transcription elongation regulator 1